MRNEDISGECWAKLFRSSCRKVQMQRGFWVWKELVKAMWSSEEEHLEFNVNCIDFPSNISVEHLTATLKYETYNSR